MMRQRCVIETKFKHKLYGCCFDRAPSVAKRLNGVQKILFTKQPKLLFVHVHTAYDALDLAL